MSNENKNYPPKIILALRLAGGIYLAYLAWDLLGAVFSHTGMEQLGFGAAVVVFAVVGIALAFVSARAWMRGEYKENMED